MASDLFSPMARQPGHAEPDVGCEEQLRCHPHARDHRERTNGASSRDWPQRPERVQDDGDVDQFLRQRTLPI